MQKPLASYRVPCSEPVTALTMNEEALIRREATCLRTKAALDAVKRNCPLLEERAGAWLVAMDDWVATQKAVVAERKAAGR